MKRSTIIWILLFIFLGYIASIVVPMYYRHQMMVFEVKGQVKIAHMYNEYEIMEHLLISVDEWELPLDADDIIVDLRDYDIIITMRYYVDKTFLTFYKYRFNFLIREAGELKDD